MLSRHLRSHLILAPSTSIGKSVVATSLTISSLSLGELAAYCKPVGTGSVQEDDELHVKRFAPTASTSCLYHFDEPVSPHLAAQRAKDRSAASTFPTDHEFVARVSKEVTAFARSIGGKNGAMYIESAGGVHSPSLSGSSQLDLYRPLLPPSILVGSHELGGISTTISAYESLLIRGYDVDSVLVFKEDYYRNFEYFQQYFSERGISVGIIAQLPPTRSSSQSEDLQSMSNYYASITPSTQKIVQQLREIHQKRIARLEEAPRKSLDAFWWPFVQHGKVTREEDVMVIDSAHGDFFSVYQDTNKSPSPSIPSSTSIGTAATAISSPMPLSPATSASISPLSPSSDPALSISLLRPVYDGSASWWTQSLGHAHPSLALAAAHAAGRYGHILFPSATSTPSLSLATTLLATVGNRWASRVFYSDDGSTGMEVGLKMALRAFARRAGMEQSATRGLAVLGLKGSYHGDTIGAMDACEGGVFNERVEWYGGRGFWLDPPVVKIEFGGAVVVRTVEGGKEEKSFASLSEVYDVQTRLKEDSLAGIYRGRIAKEIEDRYKQGKIQFGTLILEPVVMGAGGMIFVDPLYQHVLVDLVRTDRRLFPDSLSPANSLPAFDSTPVWQGLPIIFDEVFVGLRRLGRLSGSSFIGASPDIACYAKILTGGLVPLAVTLASDSIFQAFWGEEKVDALLHGHSYSAHPVGCAVAVKSLEIMERLEKDGIFEDAKKDWSIAQRRGEDATMDTATSAARVDDRDPAAWSLWSHEFVTTVSSLPTVSGVMSLGTVLAIHLSTSTAGYSSTAAESLLKVLRYGELIDGEDGGSPAGQSFSIHARPLGNIVYFMSSLNSRKETLRSVEQALLKALSKKA